MMLIVVFYFIGCLAVYSLLFTSWRLKGEASPSLIDCIGIMLSILLSWFFVIMALIKTFEEDDDDTKFAG